MDTIHEESAGRQNPACKQEPSTVQLQPDTPHFIFLLQVREETCQNKLSGSRGLSKSHQSLCHLLFCFCARQQCYLPLEFLHFEGPASSHSSPQTCCMIQPQLWAIQALCISFWHLYWPLGEMILTSCRCQDTFCFQFHPTQVKGRLGRDASSIFPSP